MYEGALVERTPAVPPLKTPPLKTPAPDAPPAELIALFDLRERLLAVADLEWEERELGFGDFLEVDRRAEAQEAARIGVAAYLDDLAEHGDGAILEEVFAVTPLSDGADGRFALCTDACPTFTLDQVRQAEAEPTAERAAIALYEAALYGLPPLPAAAPSPLAA